MQRCSQASRLLRPLLRGAEPKADTLQCRLRNLSSLPSSESFDIVIVGGGLVGSAIAAALGKDHLFCMATSLCYNALNSDSETWQIWAFSVRLSWIIGFQRAEGSEEDRKLGMKRQNMHKLIALSVQMQILAQAISELRSLTDRSAFLVAIKTADIPSKYSSWDKSNSCKASQICHFKNARLKCVNRDKQKMPLLQDHYPLSDLVTDLMYLFQGLESIICLHQRAQRRFSTNTICP